MQGIDFAANDAANRPRMTIIGIPIKIIIETHKSSGKLLGHVGKFAGERTQFVIVSGAFVHADILRPLSISFINPKPRDYRMKINYTATALATFFFCATPAAFAQTSPLSATAETNIKSIPPVGTIIASALTWEEFAAVTNEGSTYWIPADGRSAPPESKYFQIKKGKPTDDIRVPDLRGKFQRGLNSFSDDRGPITDGTGDPDSNRQLLSYQADAFQKHRHTITRASMGGSRAWLKGWFWASADGSSGSQTGITDPDSYPADGDAARAAVETRAKNISVIYYIRVN